MGISDRKRSIDVPVNINLDLNQEIKPNQFLVDNNIKSGDFVSRKKSGNIIAGSKLNVDGQGIFNVKIFKNEIVKKLPMVSPGSEGIPPTPSVTPLIILTTTPTPTPSITPTNTITPTVTPTVTSTITPTPSTTPPPSFVSVWRTTGATESITLPYIVSGTYSGTIDWGDGNTSTNSYANRTHTYSTPGNYTVTIYGTLNGWSFNNTGDKLKIREILRWGPWKGQNSYGGSFWGCSNLILTGVTDTPNLSNVNVTYMFANCSSITTINNINSWDVSNVTSFERIFLNCTSFNQDISNWDVSNCENFTGMFYECNVFNNGLSSGVSGNGLNNWVISSTGTSIIMSSMFTDCWSFNQDISSWNMSKVTDISIMFYQCFVFNQPIQNWERTSPDISTMSGVTTMSSTFRYTYLFNQPIGNWNVSNLIDGTGLFGVATSFNQPLSGWNVSNLVYAGAMFASMSFNQNIGNWDVSKVVDMQVMFQNNGVFNNGGSPTINNWNVSSVTNMSGTFYGCSNFNQPLSGWNVANVSIMSVTFYACSLFNQPIGNWNVSGVTTMSGMFALSTMFNQDIGGWDVSKVTDFSSMFSGANNFNNGGSPSISGWTINTTTNILMSAMFATANQFNQPIGSWNVSKVINMSQMFYANNMFNQPLSGWNVSNVNYMVQMFGINSTFNQPIGNWNVSNVTNMQEMFYGSPAFNQDIGNWNISGVTNFIDFMTFKTPSTFSTTNLDSIYNGWSTKNPKPNLSINFGTANYTTSVSGAGKGILTTSTGSGGYGWTITDGGGI